MASTSPITAAPFAHSAFLYADDEEFLRVAVPFVEAGLSAGEPVLVAVPRPRLALLRDQLPEPSPRLRFSPMEEMGRNPAWIIPAWADFIRAHGDHGALRGIGEPIWDGRSAEELVECERHESLLNMAFADTTASFQLLCPYHTSLADAVLDEAFRNHPHVSSPGDRLEESETYRRVVPPWLDASLAPPPPGASPIAVDGPVNLRRLRQQTAEAALAAGVPRSRVDDLMVAVSEAATNSVQHAGGPTSILCWRDGPRFVCEVRDSGCIEDPMAGRVRPSISRPGGRGLWLIHQLCDLVQVRRLPDGQAIRLHVLI